MGISGATVAFARSTFPPLSLQLGQPRTVCDARKAASRPGMLAEEHAEGVRITVTYAGTRTRLHVHMLSAQTRKVPGSGSRSHNGR
jgi:hypothetical protein